MKRLFFIIGFVCCAVTGFAIETLETEFTFVTYPVTRIYRNEKGVVVKLYTDTIKPRQMYLPQKWFEPTEDNSVRKAELMRVEKWKKPYVVVYYKGSDFYSAKFDTDTLVIE